MSRDWIDSSSHFIVPFENLSITCSYKSLEGGFSGSSAGKESTCNAGDSSSIPGLGSSPGEGIAYALQYSWASLEAQTVKNPPAMWETWVGKIPWRRPWEPTSVFFPRESPWPEEPGRLQFMGCKESDTIE